MTNKKGKFMNIEDIPIYARVPIEKICEICQCTQKILCSDSQVAEYEKEIWLQCTCGNFIEFIIPVN